MFNIVLTAIERGRAVVFLMGVILLSGLAVLINIPKEAEPDIPIPYIYVSVIHPGISPEDAERLLVRPLEKELMLAEGLDAVLVAREAEHGAVGEGLLVVQGAAREVPVHDRLRTTHARARRR